MQLTEREFGTTTTGEKVQAFSLESGNGLVATVMTRGATLVSLQTPDRRGRALNVVLGYDTLAEYEAGESYFGATVGRSAGIIANSKVKLDGNEFELTTNYGRHHLHGGVNGFSHRIWNARSWQRDDAVGVAFRLASPDGDQGYPGTVQVEVNYSVTIEDELRIDYSATTDKPTLVNLTHHSYFNLAGHNSGNILDQEITINSDRYVAIDDDLIPTGKLHPVAGTPWDFTLPKRIGADIRKAPLLYDHSFAVRGSADGLVLVAHARDQESGRTLEAWSTEPFVHFYTACHLANEKGADGAIYQSEQGFCLETQHISNRPNSLPFPSPVLPVGETYRSTTIYRFSAQ